MTGDQSRLKPSVFPLVIIGLAAILIALTSGVSGILGLTSGQLGFAGGLLTILAPIIQFLSQPLFLSTDSRPTNGEPRDRGQRELISELDRLDSSIREWEGENQFYWTSLSDSKRSEFDPSVRSACDDLVEKLGDLAAVNKKLRINLSRDLQADSAIVTRSLPAEAIDTKGDETRVITAWKGCVAKESVSDYEWLVDCGSVFTECESEAELRTRIEQKSSRADVHFDVSEWDGVEDTWDRKWEPTLWAAKRATDRTVWEIVGDNQTLFNRQEQLISEVFTLRSELYQLLNAGDRDTWREASAAEAETHRQRVVETALVLPRLC
ncbi:hypothetical protein ABNG02_14255 [Halorubrum ejinorense]|uniref:Uncharacterized protein n=1 Tax=Halorubrum ejinorense TaxID=425309 RepID=A0AAV3SRU8_9EURY